MKLQVLTMRKEGKSLEDATMAVKADTDMSKFLNARSFPGLWEELGK